jgi:cytochrome c biogenesis protein CcmG/thiol:disulfide interchange protein DsbE
VGRSLLRSALPALAAALALAGPGCVTAAPAPVAGAGPVRGPSPALALLEAATDLDGAPVGGLPAGGRATVAVVFASWCGHCRDQLPALAELQARHRDLRVIGVNYRGHEEYELRGGPAAVRAYVAALAPWLRVVPADEGLWRALGRPPRVPTIYVFDRVGAVVRVFDRRREEVPTLAALEAALPP